MHTIGYDTIGEKLIVHIIKGISALWIEHCTTEHNHEL